MNPDTLKCCLWWFTKDLLEALWEFDGMDMCWLTLTLNSWRFGMLDLYDCSFVYSKHDYCCFCPSTMKSFSSVVSLCQQLSDCPFSIFFCIPVHFFSVISTNQINFSFSSLGTSTSSQRKLKVLWFYIHSQVLFIFSWVTFLTVKKNMKYWHFILILPYVTWHLHIPGIFFRCPSFCIFHQHNSWFISHTCLQ